MATQRTSSSTSLVEGASFLIGELSANGTASLQHDDLSTNGYPESPPLYSQGSGASSQPSIHGELDGLIPESAIAGESDVLRSNRYNSIEVIDSTPSFKNPKSGRRRSLAVRLEKTGQAGRYQLIAEDPELRLLLKEGFERSKDGGIKKKRSRFSDLVFTRQFTAFDRQNSDSSSSPFHGFFSLFWSVPGDNEDGVRQLMLLTG